MVVFSQAEWIGIGCAVGLVAILIIAVIVVAIVLRRRQKAASRKRWLLRNVSVTSGQGFALKVTYFGPVTLPPSLQEAVDKCRIPKDAVRVGQLLGQGDFGVVCSGELRHPRKHDLWAPVTVRSIEGDNSPSQLMSFLRMATKMVDCNHANVLQVLGVIYQCEETKAMAPVAVFPLMANGNLRTFIMEGRGNLSEGDLLNFSLQIASGMKHLHEVNKYIHGDLAARNCLVDQAYVVKITDFGLRPEAGVGARVPVRWMAPEFPHTGKLSRETDVWSYGVTVWEIFSKGSTPYSDLPNTKIQSYVSDGHRLDRPKQMTLLSLYELMTRCWSADHRDRPSFASILRQQTAMAAQLSQNLTKNVDSQLRALEEDSGFHEYQYRHPRSQNLVPGELYVNESFVMETEEAPVSSLSPFSPSERRSRKDANSTVSDDSGVECIGIKEGQRKLSDVITGHLPSLIPALDVDCEGETILNDALADPPQRKAGEKLSYRASAQESAIPEFANVISELKRGGRVSVKASGHSDDDTTASKENADVSAVSGQNGRSAEGCHHR